MTVTRQQYMLAVNADRDASYAAHRTYYAQLVDDRTIRLVLLGIGREAIRTTTDPKYMNDIPLKWWDNAIRHLPTAVTFESLGDYPTLAGLVSVAKEAARQWLDTNHPTQEA